MGMNVVLHYEIQGKTEFIETGQKNIIKGHQSYVNNQKSINYKSNIYLY